ncbi:hypothetical protein GBA65_21490 (plasmid) [Rubrobacter marinus]|uniref:Histidine kinase domain-containing protein n=1 Tax=Rubrobacter marinus TaxID=2653852 RepID=A0A6G8Q3G4_9ACTN|nr:sensor histidine kinase [Rubrobacter marinus]QIN81021.1 hypothetical protein GBA65_21490 [Rubrobacter marinus]
MEGIPDLGRVRWLAILLPTLAIGIFEFMRHQWLAPVLPPWLGHGWPGNLLGALVVGGVTYGFTRIFSGMVAGAALTAARAREEAAVLVERQRLGREMHDSVAQALFYLTVRLDEVSGLVAAGDRGGATQELAAVREDVRATHGHVRSVISDLKRQADGEDFGEAMRRAARETAERLKIRVTCRVSEDARVPAAVKGQLVAIVKEALTNAQRHGGAEHAVVTVKRRGKGTELEVTDRGRGFDPGAVRGEDHYGLAIMEERALMAGGALRVSSAPGAGTSVTVWMPAPEDR